MLEPTYSHIAFRAIGDYFRLGRSYLCLIDSAISRIAKNPRSKIEPIERIGRLERRGIVIVVAVPGIP
jgi:hypothetical protein